MAEAIRERQRNNPALYLNEVYRYILRDDSLLDSLRSRGKDASCSKETLIQEVAEWIHAEQYMALLVSLCPVLCLTLQQGRPS